MTEKLHRRGSHLSQSNWATALFFLAYLAVMAVVFAPKELWVSPPEITSSSPE